MENRQKSIRKKPILCLCLTLFLFAILIPLTSASDWSGLDNIKEYEKIGTYGKITISDTDWFGSDEALVEHTLIENTEVCNGGDCYAQGNSTLYDSGSLFSKMKFYDLDMKSTNVLDNQFYIITYENYEEETNYWDSAQTKILSTNKETKQIMIKTPYDGERLPIGTYTWRMETTISEGQSVEWIGTSFGKDLDEWAIFSFGPNITDEHLMDLSGENQQGAGPYGVNRTALYNASVVACGFHASTSNITSCGILDFEFNQVTNGTISSDVTNSTCFFQEGQYNQTANENFYCWVNNQDGAFTHRFSDINATIVVGTAGNLSAGLETGGGDWNPQGSQRISDIINITTKRIDIFGITGANVILDNPPNQEVTINNTLRFDGRFIFSGVGNFTNATLMLWSSDGTLLNSNTTTISGTTNFSNLSLSTIPIGNNHAWNYFVCGINASTTDCNLAIANRTLNISIFNENSAIFNASTQETSQQSFVLNTTTNINILSISAFLDYNGTEHTSTASCSGVECTISNIIDIPLVQQESQLHTFFWNFTIFNGSESINTISSGRIQNASRIHLEQCNSTFATPALNFTTFDEQNLTRIVPFDFDGTFDFWTGSGSVSRNNSFNITANEVNLCLQPNVTMSINSTISYDETGNGTLYTDRFYYFDDKKIDNDLEHIQMYLLRSASSTSFILKVQDENLLPVADALIEIHRFYPGLGEFRVVGISRTDDNGQSVGFFQTETVDYKFIIKKDGEILLETGQQKIIPETSPFTIIFNVGQDLGEPWSSQNPIPDLESTLDFDDTNNVVTYTYVDTSNNFTQARLRVTKDSLTNISANVVVCEQNSSLSSATILCQVTNVSGFYTASSFITRSGESLDKQVGFQIEDFSSVVGNLGLFFGFFLIVISSFLFKFDEKAGIVSVTATIFLVNITGLIKFGGVFVTAIIFVAITLIWIMERPGR